MLRLYTQIFVVLLFCVAASVASAGLTDGLISAWTFEGDNLNDIMGNANGSLVGGAGYGDGVHGRALDVNGVDAYAEIPTILPWMRWRMHSRTPYERLLEPPAITAE